MPPVVPHSNAAHYTPESHTEVTVFEGRSHTREWPLSGSLSGDR
jgi:hypothetical protein